MTELASVPRFPRRLVYLGTPEDAVAPLKALHEAGFEVVTVVSRADVRRGRRGKAVASPVKAAAIELGIPVISDLDELRNVDAELGVVVAFGQLISSEILQQLPMVNLHFSKLPRWRGAAPVERAILAGDTKTAVCIMGLEVGLDTGPIYAQESVDIEANVTATVLREELSNHGAELLVRVLESGLSNPVPQAGEPSYAHKFTGEDFILDWEISAEQLDRLIRVGNARTSFRNRLFKIHEAFLCESEELAPGIIAGRQVGTGSNNLELVSVQPEGKKKMSVDAWLNGVQLEPGEVFGI